MKPKKYKKYWLQIREPKPVVRNLPPGAPLTTRIRAELFAGQRGEVR